MSGDARKLAEGHVGEALRALGLMDDPEAAGAPEGFVSFLAGLDPRREPPELELLQSTSEDPLILRDIPFHSMCAHHMVPFFGSATIGIRPSGRIVGLGAMVRLLHHHALRLQIQERLGRIVAEDLMERLGACTAVVRLEARHMCMEMRGVRTPALVETMAWRGAEDPALDSMLRKGG